MEPAYFAAPKARPSATIPAGRFARTCPTAVPAGACAPRVPTPARLATMVCADWRATLDTPIAMVTPPPAARSTRAWLLLTAAAAAWRAPHRRTRWQRAKRAAAGFAAKQAGPTAMEWRPTAAKCSSVLTRATAGRAARSVRKLTTRWRSAGRACADGSARRAGQTATGCLPTAARPRSRARSIAVAVGCVARGRRPTALPRVAPTTA